MTKILPCHFTAPNGKVVTIFLFFLFEKIYSTKDNIFWSNSSIANVLDNLPPLLVPVIQQIRRVNLEGKIHTLGFLEHGLVQLCHKKNKRPTGCSGKQLYCTCVRSCLVYVSCMELGPLKAHRNSPASPLRRAKMPVRGPSNNSIMEALFEDSVYIIYLRSRVFAESSCLPE